MVWVSDAETSIKTWWLSLHLSLALRRKQPQPQISVFFLLQTHTHSPPPAGIYRARDRSELVLHWREYQILVRFHQLSVSDRYFCWAGQEIRLLNYSFSQDLHHFVQLSYRCSIKVSHCNHHSFPWLNTVFQQTQNAALSRLSEFPSLHISFSRSLVLDSNVKSIPRRSAGVSGQSRTRAGAKWITDYHADNTAIILGQPYHICIMHCLTTNHMVWNLDKKWKLR